MLKLINVSKDYPSPDGAVRALRGVSLNFRKSEFVSILGPSGCGKTTLLNIIGGLDHYTDGDLQIEGKSTKEYGSRDWDTYRNHRIGFVFQSYNLIPHQTVLANVELSLTLSGISPAERREMCRRYTASVGTKMISMTACGAVSDITIVKRYGYLGIHVGCDYGLTECSPQVTIAGNLLHPKAGSVGSGTGNYGGRCRR